MRVAFIHPDLGIGGAERLVVDAALALVSKGHQVEFYTSHHDPSHCFPETLTGAFPVHVYGDWLPRSLFGKFSLVFALLRMLYLSIAILFQRGPKFDIFFVDQISASIPLLKLSSAKIFFYCHFPDQLLTKRESFWKKLYRAPLDFLEEWTTGQADLIVVNSLFTQSVFTETFTSLRKKEKPIVLYPSLNTTQIDKLLTSISSKDCHLSSIPPNAKTMFLSINRYEHKKNIRLAISAFAQLKNSISPNLWDGLILVIAGGFDHRVSENQECFSQLSEFTKSQGLLDHVVFMRSISDAEKFILIKRCKALLYTPDQEHFGIVPIEAMYCQRAVIAVCSGGPLETIHDPKYPQQQEKYSSSNRSSSKSSKAKQTGFLCEPHPDEFCRAMELYLRNPSLAESHGIAGKERVAQYFSFEAFASRLDSLLSSFQQRKIS